MSFDADTSYQDKLISQYEGLLSNFLIKNVTQLSQRENEQLTGLILTLTGGADEGNIAPVAMLLVVSYVFKAQALLLLYHGLFWPKSLHFCSCYH